MKSKLPDGFLPGMQEMKKPDDDILLRRRRTMEHNCFFFRRRAAKKIGIALFAFPFLSSLKARYSAEILTPYYDVYPLFSAVPFLILSLEESLPLNLE